MAKCTKCGAELEAGKKFCGNCGEKVSFSNVESKNVTEDNFDSGRDTVLKVYGGLAIIGLIMMVLGLFSYDLIKAFYYTPGYRLIDIIAGFILLVLGTILFSINRRK